VASEALVETMACTLAALRSFSHVVDDIDYLAPIYSQR